jgi:hypothetical protein
VQVKAVGKEKGKNQTEDWFYISDCNSSSEETCQDIKAEVKNATTYDTGSFDDKIKYAWLFEEMLSNMTYDTMFYCYECMFDEAEVTELHDDMADIGLQLSQDEKDIDHNRIYYNHQCFMTNVNDNKNCDQKGAHRAKSSDERGKVSWEDH